MRQNDDVELKIFTLLLTMFADSRKSPFIDVTEHSTIILLFIKAPDHGREDCLNILGISWIY